MGDIEVGRCQTCGKEDIPIYRKYYHYDIKCECHSPQHFEIVYYCSDCEPKEPYETRINLKVEDLKKLLRKGSLNNKLKKVQNTEIDLKQNYKDLGKKMVYVGDRKTDK